MKNAVALGTFDGLHIGHSAVLDLPHGYNKTALTFEIPPKAVMSGDTQLLMTCEQKEKRLNALGITVHKLKFREICNMSAEDFLDFVLNTFSPDYISCGFNYRFGSGGIGDNAMLSEFCKQHNIKLKVCEAVVYDGETVSSTRIRNLLGCGKIKEANAMLSEPFCFEAEVIHGDKRGRTLGFPTMNQKYPTELATLKFGVYKTQITVNGKKYTGITNIGKRPTYPSDFVIAETHIENFNGDLYGKTVTAAFSQFLREEIKFSSEKELKNQIIKDINLVRSN